jgi:hypothetical protein
MGLHVAVMVITVGTAASSATAHQAHRAPVVVVQCTGAATIDLRTGSVRCLDPLTVRHRPPVPAPAAGYHPAVLNPAPASSAPRSPAVVLPPPTSPNQPATIRAAAPRRVTRRAAPAPTPRCPAPQRPTVLRDNGIWRASATTPAQQTPWAQTFDPDRTNYPPATEFLGSGSGPIERILAQPPRHDFGPATGERHHDGPSIASQIGGGVLDGLKACGKGAMVGTTAGAVEGAGFTALSAGAGSPSIPVAAGIGAVTGCAGGIVTHMLSAF